MKKILDHITADALNFIHITDTHLLNQAEETLYNLNTKNCLESVMSHCQAQYPNIDFILFTGDISQTGTKESYAIFKSILQNYNLPVYCIPGNHDTPVLLQQVIPSCPDDSINIVEFGRFSLVLLNSWVKDEHHGFLNENCLRQLDEYLQNNNDQLNIIAIHHPPVLINSKWLDELGLQNQTAFLQVLNKHSQNALLLCGHVHQEVDQQVDRLRLLATPSTCHQFLEKSDHRRHIYMPAPAYRFVSLSATYDIKTKVHYIE